MTKEIKVKAEVTKDIQEKDVAMQTAKDILIDITDIHANDTDASLIKSPVYQELQKDVEEKRIAWEQAKDSMVEEYIPKDMQSKVKQWSLDYNSSILYVEV